MKRAFIPCFCFCIALYMGCASVPIRTDYDRSVDFTPYKTFEWMPYPEAPNLHPMARDQETIAKIRDIVDKELTNRGLERVRRSPDFVILYEIVVENQSDLAISGSSDHTVGRRGTDVIRYQLGNIVLHFFDAQTRKRIWKSAAQGALDSRIIKPEQKWERLSLCLQNMIEEFPSNKSG